MHFVNGEAAYMYPMTAFVDDLTKDAGAFILQSSCNPSVNCLKITGEG